MEWLSSRTDEDTIVYEEDVLKSTLIYSSWHPWETSHVIGNTLNVWVRKMEISC